MIIEISLIKFKMIFLMLISENMIYKETLTFDGIRIENCNFHFSKKPVDINDVNSERILLSDNHSIGKNYFKSFVGDENYVIINMLFIP